MQANCVASGLTSLSFSRQPWVWWKGPGVSHTSLQEAWCEFGKSRFWRRARRHAFSSTCHTLGASHSLWNSISSFFLKCFLERKIEMIVSLSSGDSVNVKNTIKQQARWAFLLPPPSPIPSSLSKKLGAFSRSVSCGFCRGGEKRNGGREDIAVTEKALSAPHHGSCMCCPLRGSIGDKDVSNQGTHS